MTFATTTIVFSVLGMILGLLSLVWSSVRQAGAQVSTHVRYLTTRNLRTTTGVFLVEPFGFYSATESRRTMLARTRAPARVRADYFMALRQSDGVFWIQCRVGEEDHVSRVWAVLDTGSSHLVLAAPACAKCRQDRYGSMHAPKDHNITHRDVSLEFGSQRVTGNMAQEVVQLLGFPLDTGAVQPASQWRAPGTEPSTEAAHVSMQVLAMTAVTGNTAANVFGISPTFSSSGASQDTVLLDALMPQHSQRFGVMLGRQSGLLTFGPPPPTPDIARMRYVPLRHPPTVVRNSPTQFMMTPLVDVMVGRSLEQMQSIFHHVLLPTDMWVMFDTGCTNTYTSKALSEPLHHTVSKLQADVTDGSLFWSLVLQNGVHFILSPSVYMWQGRSTIDTTRSFMEDITGVAGVLVGCMASRGLYIDHDVAGRRLGFAPVHADADVRGSPAHTLHRM